MPAVSTSTTYRERVLWEIAERYHDLTEVLNGPGGIRGDGGSVIRMPRTYTATVREFERLLRVMRDTTPALYWHLLEWHLKAQRVTRHRPITAKRGSKQAYVRNRDGSPVTRPEIDYTRHPRAREAEARRAVAWMARRWGLGAEPMLPVETLAA